MWPNVNDGFYDNQMFHYVHHGRLFVLLLLTISFPSKVRMVPPIRIVGVREGIILNVCNSLHIL